MEKHPIAKGILRNIFILLLACWSINGRSQQRQSALLDKDMLVIKSEGTAFLGSGITEDDAKKIAINDAKRTALEQAGTYLESHTEVLNYTLLKDELITYTGGLLKVSILNEKRALINDMFAFKVDIEATVDTRLLNQRIEEIRQDYSLKRLLESARERNKQLEARIAELQASLGTVSQQEIKSVMNTLSATDWYNKGFETKEPALQVEYYTKAIELDPQDFYSYGNRGLAYDDLGQYEKAIKDYNKVIELDPLNALAYNNRGLVYKNLGQYEKAIEDYNKAIAMAPQEVDAYVNRGAVYRKQGQYEAALEDYDKAIQLEPQCAPAYYNRGLVHVNQGQFEKANLDFTRAIDLGDQNASSYNIRGVTYCKLGQYEVALKDFNKAIQLDPQHNYAYRNRGMAYVDLEQYEAAITDFDKDIELNPQYAVSYYKRGFAYHNLAQLTKAVQDYSFAISLDPQYADAYYHRGVARWIINQESEAVDDLNTYLKINGGNGGLAEKARQIISELGYTPKY